MVILEKNYFVRLMRALIFLVLILTCIYGCDNAGSTNKVAPILGYKRQLVASADTLIPVDTTPASLRPYTILQYTGVQKLNAAPGTKSVLFNADGSRLYAMNLEGMSIYEFDQQSKKVLREFRFKPTPGEGWDYETNKPIPSFEEKPVEACLSHGDKFLWVSLHNAAGIVPIPLENPEGRMIPDSVDLKKLKRIRIIYPGSNEKDSFLTPLIPTGKTPKIIARTANNENLLVSNWHSYNVSVLAVDTSRFPYAKVINTIPVSSIPRGIAVEDEFNRSFVAIMGGAAITVINNSVWMKEKDIPVASNPRHIVTDTSGHLFVSYNKLGKIACIDSETGKTLFTATTKAQPRTLILSKNHKFIFVTCYSSDMVEVFKINDNSFTKVASLPCAGHPVGVDVVENNETLEAWVCSYTTGSISIFKFKKK